MFLLLLFGAGYGVVSDPTLIEALRHVHPELRMPSFALSHSTPNDFFLGAVFLALPQVPLTLGNAIIAITEENNRLFPDRFVNESKISTSTGLMNLWSASVVVCPCAMARAAWQAMFRFGARTGGGARHPRRRASHHSFLVQWFDSDALSSFPACCPWRHPILDRGSARARSLRYQQGQGRTLRDGGYRRAFCLECRHRLCRWRHRQLA